jgi:hypothetical protein
MIGEEQANVKAGRLPVASQVEFLSQSVGRVARLSGNVRQPNQVTDDQIAGHQVEQRPGAGEAWPATTKHDGAR